MDASQQLFCWDNAKVEIAIRYGLKRFVVNFAGSFARLGSHPKCEIRVPFGQNSVLAFLQVVKGGLAVVTLPPEGSHRCQTQFVETGDSLSLTSPISMSVESIELQKTQSDLHCIKHNQTVSPDLLLLMRGSVKGGLRDASFLVANGISILGRSESCQLKLRHRTIAPYQCAIIRSDGSSPCMRIVDLLSHHSTTIGNQIARGQKLGIEDVLTLGKLVFVAKRAGYWDAQRIRSSEQHLEPPDPRDVNKFQIVDSERELEIVNDLVLSHIVSNQQVEARSSSENQLLLLELTRSMVSLVERIEKIELSLGYLPLQIEKVVSNEVSFQGNETTNLASDRASPVDALTTGRENGIQCTEKIDQLQQVEKENLPSPVYVSPPFLGSLVLGSNSLDASEYEESPAEAHVLGQLIELRTRTGKRNRLKIIVVAVACFVVAAFVITMVWYRIPIGWRERIWQFSAFTSI